MAVVLITSAKEYMGTAAERVVMITTELTAGSTFYEWDTKLYYIWDSTAWRAL